MNYEQTNVIRVNLSEDEVRKILLDHVKATLTKKGVYVNSHTMEETLCQNHYQVVFTGITDKPETTMSAPFVGCGHKDLDRELINGVD